MYVCMCVCMYVCTRVPESDALERGNIVNKLALIFHITKPFPFN